MSWRNCRMSPGVALVLVLWIITLLSLIALSFVNTLRSDVALVGNGLTRVRAQAVADAGIQRAAFELFKPVVIPGRWALDGTPHEWPFEDAMVSITLADETARIDINTASEALLRGLLVSQGVGQDAAIALVDAMADWRDADSQKRLHGAEEPEYAAAGLNYKPANAPFQSIEELQKVLGMNAALYARIAPYITVHSRQPGVYTQAAARAVLQAIPNVTSEQIEQYLQQREQARANQTPIPAFAAGAAFASAGGGYIARVRAEARLADGTTFIREAVLRHLGNPKRPYAFLQWKEGREIVESAESTDPTPLLPSQQVK